MIFYHPFLENILEHILLTIHLNAFHVKNVLNCFKITVKYGYIPLKVPIHYCNELLFFMPGYLEEHIMGQCHKMVVEMSP
jgi:hypothetical protein